MQSDLRGSAYSISTIPKLRGASGALMTAFAATGGRVEQCHGGAPQSERLWLQPCWDIRCDIVHTTGQRQRAGQEAKEREVEPSFSHGSSTQRQNCTLPLATKFGLLFDLDHTKTKESKWGTPDTFRCDGWTSSVTAERHNYFKGRATAVAS